MAEHIHTSSPSIRATDILFAVRAIVCLAETVADRLAVLQRVAADMGADIASAGDWQDVDMLLQLAIEQAQAVERAELQPCHG